MPPRSVPRELAPFFLTRVYRTDQQRSGGAMSPQSATRAWILADGRAIADDWFAVCTRPFDVDALSPSWVWERRTDAQAEPGRRNMLIRELRSGRPCNSRRSKPDMHCPGEVRSIEGPDSQNPELLGATNLPCKKRSRFRVQGMGELNRPLTNSKKIRFKNEEDLKECLCRLEYLAWNGSPWPTNGWYLRQSLDLVPIWEVGLKSCHVLWKSREFRPIDFCWPHLTELQQERANWPWIWHALACHMKRQGAHRQHNATYARWKSYLRHRQTPSPPRLRPW